jgi:hypothetical protein
MFKTRFKSKLFSKFAELVIKLFVIQLLVAHYTNNSITNNLITIKNSN